MKRFILTTSCCLAAARALFARRIYGSETRRLMQLQASA